MIDNSDVDLSGICFLIDRFSFQRKTRLEEVRGLGHLLLSFHMNDAAGDFTLDESGSAPVVRYTLGGQSYGWEISPQGVTAL